MNSRHACTLRPEPFNPATPGRLAGPWLLALSVAIAYAALSTASVAQANQPEAASAGNSGTETAAVDPVERLRERLAERLSGSKSGSPASSTQLRVVNLPPTSRATSNAAAEALPRAQPSTRARTATSANMPARAAGNARGDGNRGAKGGHWSYSGEVGPQAWGGLRPEFSACGNGERQSPIDIREGLAVDLEPVRFRYQASNFGVIDNGHTVQVNMAPGNSMEVGGRRYELLQFHFHRPSEERIDGRQFEMSVHLVHKDSEGRLAVLAVLLGKGAAQPVVQTVWNNLPLEKHQEQRARVQIDPTELLPEDRRYYTYMGSLTTPPCTEGVQWVVMRQPVAAAPEQIDIFTRLYPMNARPLQSAAGRRILQSE